MLIRFYAVYCLKTIFIYDFRNKEPKLVTAQQSNEYLYY